MFMVTQLSLAQVDTEFWFAPPEITSGHGDSPLYLRLSTLDRSATVRITQPARSNLLITQVIIDANTTRTVDLTSQKNNLETIVPASVMKTGLKIESSAPITAYYEVGAPWNSDIFTLKGKNALGNRFVIPGQNFYNNSTDYSPTPYFSFDIIATSNNTVVKVKPSKPLYGYAGDTLIIIRLNAGETYSLRKITTLAADNPIGTIVESNKPIAITLKDDSVINEGCRDMLGDQMVPVEVAGTEYVVLRGFLTNQEYLFVTAIEDNTSLFFNTDANPRENIRAGEVYRYAVSENATYIRSTKPVYVFHVTGFGCEMGMAILPSITCKGSTQIGFSRTTNEFFGLNILVRKEGIGHFKLNNSDLVPASAFSPVPGASDKWYTAQLSFSTAQIGVGQASLITNTQNSFQIGIINGNATTTCKYGYFSSFSTLFIGDDFAICEGQATTLDAGPDKKSYLWSNGATTQSITVSDPGEYWVKIVREECVLYDTVSVEVRKGQLEIGDTVSMCPGESAVIDGKENFSWYWSDGGTDRYLQTRKTGKYWVSVFDYTGCQASDTVFVELKPSAAVDLGNDVIKCPHDTARFDVTYPSSSYLWSDGKTTETNSFSAAGTYWVNIFFNGCISRDTVVIENLPGPLADSIYGSPSVCPWVENVQYAADTEIGSDYKWFVNGGNFSITATEKINVNWGESKNDASVKLVVTNSLGCRTDTIQFPVRINTELIVEIPFGPDTLCVNKAINVIYNTGLTNGSVYQWDVTGGDIVSGQGSSEVAITWREGLNRLLIKETSTTIDTVCTGISPELKVFVFRDQAQVNLHTISIDTLEPNRVHIDWNYLGNQNHHPINLYRRFMGEPVWQLVNTLTPETEFRDDGIFTSENALEYFIGSINGCSEEINSSVHRSVYLTGEADSTQNSISLSWNPYMGWDEGVGQYEVWRHLDEVPGYSKLVTLPSGETSLTGILSTDGFRHRYVIRTIDASGKKESWSNPLTMEFEHPVFIPNIFTPNGDDKNEFFIIRNIHLYRNSVLTIMDRWGKKVIQVRGYQNNWDGGGVSSGVYFYSLHLDKGRQYKGVLSVAR